jgi:HSP20 family molecular chaperone IbpA
MMAFYAYPPDFYYTTGVEKSFPVHHYPFEHARHKVSHLLENFDSPIPKFHVPKADIRETVSEFFIDVELPGVEETEDVKLRWNNSRTLMVDAKAEGGHYGFAVNGRENSVVSDGEVKTNGGKTKEDGRGEKVEEKDATHVTLGERWHGKMVRAFNFPVDVRHEGLKAKLRAGVLRMEIPKVEVIKEIETNKVVKG